MSQPDTTDNDHLLLGNPTAAVSDPVYNTNYLKHNGTYVISYSAVNGIPVWVSWHLQSEDFGFAERTSSFRSDVLPDGFYRVPTSAYTNSGFDRGHNCPSADRTLSQEANASTFLMTNIIPQAPSLNRVVWAGLEEHIRQELGNSSEAYIIMGNFSTGGVGSQGRKENLDNSRVVVPAHIWKVVVMMPKGSNDLKRLDTSAKIIAVQVPNDETVFIASTKNQWKQFTTTISEIEKASGAAGVRLHLLSNTAPAVRAYLLHKKSIQ